MNKNHQIYSDWENRWLSAQKPDLMANLRLSEALREEALHLGAWLRADPLEGITEKIRFAKDINVRTAA